jgi:hypothetical protein
MEQLILCSVIEWNRIDLLYIIYTKIIILLIQTKNNIITIRIWFSRSINVEIKKL